MPLTWHDGSLIRKEDHDDGGEGDEDDDCSGAPEPTTTAAMASITAALLPDFFSHASLVPELHRQIRRFHADACTTQWQDLRKH